MIKRTIWPWAGPTILPSFSSRNSRSPGGTQKGAGLRRLSQLIISQGMQWWEGRADRGRGRAGSRRSPQRATPGTLTTEGAEETEVGTSTRRASSSTSTPLAGPGRAGGEKALREATQRASRGATLLSRPSVGREENEGRTSGCVTSEEVPARGEEFDTKERKSLKGGWLLRSIKEQS